MAIDIRIEKTTQSKRAEIDMSNLPFGRVFSDHMFVVDFIDGHWTNACIKPVQNFQMHPANMALHYGQSIFEGMKAGKNQDGTPLLFRPEMNAKRLNASAIRMGMQPFPVEDFLHALDLLLDLDKAWIPDTEGSSLYIRPFMFATDEFIGVRPSETYRLVIFTCPVGTYYSKPVRLLASTEYIRAAVGGVGEAKTAGNYAAALYPSARAVEAGCDQILWLDAKEFKYVQEVGTMNIFFVFEDKIVTPDLNGAILHGITRDSFISVLKEMGHRVEERPLSMDEIVEAHSKGTLKEVFGAGTAASASAVTSIKYKEETYDIAEVNGPITSMLRKYIQDLRYGHIADTHGWMRAVAPAAMA